MKRLIVNADDFGMSPAVNAGIVEAHRRGIVTSTTILANGGAFAEAVELCRSHPRLDVGVHLNVVEGRPVAPESRVASLVSRRGTFPGASWPFALRQWLGRVDERDLITEFTAQIQKVIDAGIRPTHVDSHMHTHALPGVLRALSIAATSFGIRRIRVPIEEPLRRRWKHRLNLTSRAKSLLIGCLAAESHGLLIRHGMRTTDHFLGPQLMGRLDSRLLGDVIALLPHGVTELMCHPASTAAQNGGILRDQELTAFTSRRVRRATALNGVNLVGFSSL